MNNLVVYIVFAYDDAYRFSADDQIIGIFKSQESADKCLAKTRKETTYKHVMCEVFEVQD